jgi:Tol biopolymer transport system component
MGSRLKTFVAFRRPIPPLLLAAGVIVALAVPGSAGAATPGKIAFVSNRDGPDEIYVMNADGSGQTRLTTSAANVDNFDPAWSPDGKQIAFFSNRDNPGNESDLWIMNADGSSPRQVTTNTINEYSVDWAPDGSRLVFNQTATPTDNMWLINADGSGLRQLSFYTTGGGPFGAHFSPDGTQIVFTENLVPTPDPLRLISPDGVLGATLTPGMNGFAPDFTADGKRIVFYSDVDGDDEIYSIAAAGGDQKQLTNTPTVAGNTDEDDAPSPSRDGLNRIAFRSARGGDREIYLMNADGSGVVQLTNTTGTNRGPDWQPTAVCQGKVATIVGTAASETLSGGPSADVISGQGGKDQISGLAGNDIICGDAGKDTLKGGKGKDVLNGGKANDRLIGGKGKDKCIGGKGKKDTGKSCEKEKKIP